MIKRKSPDKGTRVGKFITYGIAGFFVALGLLILILARQWAGFVFIAIGGLYVWFYRLLVRRAARTEAAKQAAATPGTAPRKVERFTKWQWFDWAIFVVLGTIFILLFRGEGNFAFRIGYYFGIGVGVGAIYHITLRRLWIARFPHLYREWVCSKCKKTVLEEANKCPNCGVKFV
jgi:hypothetical protein